MPLTEDLVGRTLRALRGFVETSGMKHGLLFVKVHAAMTSQAVAQQQCHPSYQGTYVPVASDVNRAGGSGNGPAYVSAPVYVVGSDVYDLDRDGNGVACE